MFCAPLVPVPGNNNELYIKYGSLATLTTQLIVIELDSVVVFAVAVNNELVLATTVGVPDMFAPVKLNPVGNVLALYVMPDPTALVALSVILAIATLAAGVYVALAVGLLHVTTSGITAILNARLVSCCSASVALTVNEYVVGLADN